MLNIKDFFYGNHMIFKKSIFVYIYQILNLEYSEI